MSNISETLLLGEIKEDAGSSGERAALRIAESKMLQVEQKYPDWWSLYEDVVPDTAARAEVVELLATAPDDFSRGVIYGKYLMRLEIAAITKRPWL